MKKKLIFPTIIGLVLLVSGVASVSAYEGHVVDIRAHVENAIGVTPTDLNLGTVFPQQVVESQVAFGLSQSFLNQTNYSSVNYELAWELKPSDEVSDFTPSPLYTPSGSEVSYYEPLNPYLNVTLSNGTGTINGNVNTVPAPGQAVVFCTNGELSDSIQSNATVGTPTNQSMDILHLTFSAPVFEGYYNSITDAGVKPSNWVYGMLDEGQFTTTSDNLSNANGQTSYQVTVPQADLGINLKIQVTGFAPHIQ